MHNINEICFANNIFSQLIISSTWDMMCTQHIKSRAHMIDIISSSHDVMSHTQCIIANRAGTIYRKYRYSVYISILNIDKNNSNHTYLILNFMHLKFSFEPIRIQIFLKVSSMQSSCNVFVIWSYKDRTSTGNASMNRLLLFDLKVNEF